MSEKEMVETFSALMASLRSRDLQSIVTSVEEQLEEGFIVKEKVKVDRSLFAEDELQAQFLSATGSSTRSLYRRAEYGPKERLRILLSAIETTIVNPIRVRNQVTQFFLRESQRNGSIEAPNVILYGSVDERIEPETLSVSETETELNDISVLIEAITALKKEL